VNALTVERLGAGRYSVPCGGSCGGSGHHIVTIDTDVVRCDCTAGAFRRACKHVDAVTRYLINAPVGVTTAAGPGIAGVDIPLPDDQPDGAA
jgi:hypothetical protein